MKCIDTGSHGWWHQHKCNLCVTLTVILGDESDSDIGWLHWQWYWMMAQESHLYNTDSDIELWHKHKCDVSVYITCTQTVIFYDWTYCDVNVTLKVILDDEANTCVRSISCKSDTDDELDKVWNLSHKSDPGLWRQHKLNVYITYWVIMDNDIWYNTSVTLKVIQIDDNKASAMLYICTRITTLLACGVDRVTTPGVGLHWAVVEPAARREILLNILIISLKW